MLKSFNKIVVFDFETTGLYPSNSQIIEIGALLIEKKDGTEQIKELSLLLNADIVPPIITNITGITKQMLDTHGVPQEVGFQQLFDMIDDQTLLIAYNIQFDLSFLLHYIKTLHNRSFKFKNPILDVMAVYKDRHPYPHKLDNVVQTYHIEVPNTHRALDDVKATYEALVKMGNELDNLERYVNVLGFNPKYPPRQDSMLSYVRYIPQYGGRREIEKS
jgi:DNA polymerase III subunit epsilon